VLADGRKVTKHLFQQLLPEELNKIRQQLGESRWAAGKFELAAKLFDEITTSDEFVEFLTLPGYRYCD
jgi:malate synthase